MGSSSLLRSARSSETSPRPGGLGGPARTHEALPAVEVTLPWLTPSGPKVTHRLVFTAPAGTALWSNAFNEQTWKPALASAGIIPVPEKGHLYAAARDHGMHALRHFCASVLLDLARTSKR